MNCKRCGGSKFIYDRQLGGKLVCAKCGFPAGAGGLRGKRPKVLVSRSSTGIYKPSSGGVHGTSLATIDFQFIAIFALLIVAWIATDLLAIVNKQDFAFSSNLILEQAYRIISSPFIHVDLVHLLMNVGGIAVARYFLISLGMRSNVFFLILVMILVPFSSMAHWFLESSLGINQMRYSVGFSGVLYGIDSFLLLSSIHGKASFIGHRIGLHSSIDVRNSLLTLTVVGQLWSFMPGISLLGHESGFLAGLILFLL